MKINQRPTVLFVDDSENDIFLMRRAFEKGELMVSEQEVHNGEDAIAYLAGEGVFEDRLKYGLPSLVLLDLNMPRKSGFDVLEWVRTQPLLRSVTIMVLAASLRQDDVDRAFNLGASAYIVKPFNLMALTEMVQSLIAWTRLNHFPPKNHLVVH